MSLRVSCWHICCTHSELVGGTFLPAICSQEQDMFQWGLAESIYVRCVKVSKFSLYLRTPFFLMLLRHCLWFLKHKMPVNQEGIPEF